MISNPEHGWCNFKLGDFKGVASYLTDVPLDLINAFIDYHEKGSGVVIFDEEGSYFTLVLTAYNCGIYIIEEKEECITHSFWDMNIEDLEKELISDIESNLHGWSSFIMCGLQSKLEYEKIIKQKIDKLKSYVK